MPQHDSTVRAGEGLGDAGRVIAGKYRLIEPLGHGGMGEVWVAHHIPLGASVALKMISPRSMQTDNDAESRALRRRFLHEAQAVAALRSPHVVQILDYGLDGDTPYMVLELLEGETLEQRLTRAGTPSFDDTVRIVTHVARALQRAHEMGIVHRDLKPSNIFLVRNGDAEIAKVLDFGLAKAMKATRPAEWSNGDFLMGTMSYMSPEQALGHPLDQRSDLWSLGIVTFECVCGRLPFESKTVPDIVRDLLVRPIPMPSTFGRVPIGFDEWFAKAVSRRPEDRFQCPKEMADTLRMLLAIERTSPSILPFAMARSTAPTETDKITTRRPRAEVFSADAPDAPTRVRRRTIEFAVAALVGLGAGMLVSSTQCASSSPPERDRAMDLTASPARPPAASPNTKKRPEPCVAQSPPGKASD